VAIGQTFLTAEWRSLVFLNYEVDSNLLRPFVPRGTELDFWSGMTFLSLVGFRFLNTKICGLRVPFHSDFNEVNLRFYVVRKVGLETRRGVVFIREIVPRRAIAFIAGAFYHEKYVALPMSHATVPTCGSAFSIHYRWKPQNLWNAIQLESEGEFQEVEPGSEQKFITEHYWGYSSQPNGGSTEYEVVHPSWRTCLAKKAEFSGEVEELFGRQFAAVLQQPPTSAFLAEGSPVGVMFGRRF
jgi:uncharacterized protein YqjF (DUF2071 family)